MKKLSLFVLLTLMRRMNLHEKGLIFVLAPDGRYLVQETLVQ